MTKAVIRGLALAPAILMGASALSAAQAQEVAPLEQNQATVQDAKTFASEDLASARAQILKETNQVRAQAGLAPVAMSESLNQVAQGCSQQQAAQGYMAHCDNFAAKFPAGWTTASENVAVGYAVTEVTTGWKNSPGHYRNMTDPRATHVGIGVAYGADGTPYYTQNFGGYAPGTLPASDATSAQPAEPAKPAKPAEPAKPAKPAPTIPADYWTIPSDWLTPIAWESFFPSGSFPVSTITWDCTNSEVSWTYSQNTVPVSGQQTL